MATLAALHTKTRQRLQLFSSLGLRHQKAAGYPPAKLSSGRVASIRILSACPQAAAILPCSGTAMDVNSCISTLPAGIQRKTSELTEKTEMAKMKVAQVPKAGGDIEITEREIPSAGTGQVRIKVQACGICFSDHMLKDGLWPGVQFPRVPGHEVAGVIDEVGPGVTSWKKGDRVGVGWHGGQDNTCLACRAGDFANCDNEAITGFNFDGGYAEYMVAPIEAVVRIPDGLDPVEAAPLLCAGITTFNALRHSGAGPGDLVAVQGIGGLGHLGVQFANKFGYRVAAVGRGPENGVLAKKLGAQYYIDSKASNAAEELKKLGGARVILATAPSSKAMTEIFGGLGRNGTLLVVGADMAPLEIPGAALIGGRKRIQGWPSGTPSDSEDTLRFAAQTGVRPMIEKFPLEKAADAFARMMSGHAQFRVVLTT
jgi:D-arabinose 1-dehydrogenase-like Zn-dependent alcohol dehydrogenase